MLLSFCDVDEVGCADPEACKEVCGNSVGCSDIAYAKLVMELLPSGKKVCSFAIPLSSMFWWFSWYQENWQLKCMCRFAGSDDGCDAGGSYVISDFHLQQLQHSVHHGPVETLPPCCLWVGAHDCGQVRCHLMHITYLLKLRLFNRRAFMKEMRYSCVFLYLLDIYMLLLFCYVCCTNYYLNVIM